MRLPGTEEWSPVNVTKRIAFERNVASAASKLSVETLRNENFVNPRQAERLIATDSIFALGRAAELAFASDQVPVGIEICSEILRHKGARPRTPMQFVFYATIGALIGAFKVILSPAGMEIIRIDETFMAEDMRLLRWPTESSTQTLRLIRLAIPAAVATGFGSEFLQSFFNSEGPYTRPSVFAALISSLEFQAAAQLSSGPVRDADNPFVALSLLELDYMRRLRVIQSDIPYWSSIRPRGSIIDWPLLALWVGAVRSGKIRSDSMQSEAQDGLPSFVHSLAKSLVENTRRRSRFSDGNL